LSLPLARPAARAGRRGQCLHIYAQKQDDFRIIIYGFICIVTGYLLEIMNAYVNE